jgi:hypothetical protein
MVEVLYYEPKARGFGRLRRRDYLGEIVVDGRITLVRK